MTTRRRVLVTALAASALSFALPSFAENNLLKVVIPLTPGTTPDTIARVMSQALGEGLAMNVVVENKPGASGMIGMQSVALSTDQTTLLVVPATTLTLPHFYKQVGFDVLHGFTPITQVASSSFVLAVGNAVPATNLAEFIAWAKANPASFYASPGAGTHHHLFMEMLMQSVHIKLEHLPYKGSAPAVSDLIGGQVPTMFLPIQVAIPLRDSGRIKIIGGSLRERHPGFPEIPSLHEQGARNYNADPWYAVWGGPKISPELAEKYRRGIIAALEQPAVNDTLTKQGLIVKTSSRDDLQRMAKEESDMWTEVIRKMDIKPE